MSQNTYQETLLRAWNITEQDLALNRQGKVSEHQRQLVKQSLERQHRLTVIALLLALGIAGLGASSMWAGNTHMNPIVIAEAILVTLMYSLPAIAIALYALVLRRDLQSTTQLRFRSIHGVARIAPARGKRPYREVFIGSEEEFSISEARSYLFCPGSTYTVYLLGSEIIGVESHDTHSGYQPDNGYLPTKTFIFSTIKMGALIVVTLAVALIILLWVEEHTIHPNALVPKTTRMNTPSAPVSPSSTAPTTGAAFGNFTVDSSRSEQGRTVVYFRGASSALGIVQRSNEGLTLVPEDPRLFPFPSGSSGYFVLSDRDGAFAQVTPGQRWTALLTLDQVRLEYGETLTAFAEVTAIHALNRIPEQE